MYLLPLHTQGTQCMFVIAHKASRDEAGMGKGELIGLRLPETLDLRKLLTFAAMTLSPTRKRSFKVFISLNCSWGHYKLSVFSFYGRGNENSQRLNCPKPHNCRIQTGTQASWTTETWHLPYYTSSRSQTTSSGPLKFEIFFIYLPLPRKEEKY